MPLPIFISERPFYCDSMEFSADDNVKAKLKGMSIGWIVVKGIIVEGANSGIDKIMRYVDERTKLKFGSMGKVSDDPIIKGVRRMFSTIGIDPTKERPSGEALIRRIVGGQGIHRINTVVDFNNSLSIWTGCPCGAYDLDRISGRVAFVIGGSGERYEGIKAPSLNAENRLLTRDSISVFGGPVADSLRTAITPATKNVLFLVYCPPGIEEGFLREVIKGASDEAKSAIHGDVVESGIYPIS